MDISYLLLLQYIRTVLGGIFDSFMLYVSDMSMIMPTFLIMSAIYWCIDKRMGQKIALNVAMACTLNQVIKNLFKIERPWIRSEDIHPVDGALTDATGYSFPSGHTSRAVANYGAIGWEYCKHKDVIKRILGIIFWIYVAILMLSRNYLGVHTLQDVLGAFILGIVIIIIIDKLMYVVDKIEYADIFIWLVICMICIAPMFKLGLLSNAGAGIGFATGWLLERKLVQFENNKYKVRKDIIFIRFLIGAFILVVLKNSLSVLLGMFIPSRTAVFISNIVISIYVMFVYPCIFDLFERKVFDKKSITIKKAYLSVFTAIIICGIILSLSAAIKHKYDNDFSSDTVVEVEEKENDSETENVIETSISSTSEVMKIIAHRGYSSEYPENTMPSFEAAIDIGADYIETDVQMTKDGRLVLFHDNTLTRVTGNEGSIIDYTYDELLGMDFGRWFSEDFAGTKIPELDELLDLVSNTDDINIYLELKDVGDVEGFADSVYQAVADAGLLDRVIFASFNYDYLTNIKSIDSNADILYNTMQCSETLPQTNPAEYYGLYVEQTTASIVQSIHDAGDKAFVWTVDDPFEMQILASMGVDGIVTNKSGVGRVAVHTEYNFLCDNYSSSITIPGLYDMNLTENNDSMVVQGFTKAGDKLIVSAYSKNGDNSILYITDLEGNLIQYVDLQFVAHVGGIAYDEQNAILWVTGAEGTVNAIRYTDIINNLYNGDILFSFDAGLVNHNGTKVASYLAYYSGELFVGSYCDGMSGILNRYDISDYSNPVLVSQYNIPERIQGVTFKSDFDGVEHIIMSQGYQTENSHLLDFIYDKDATEFLSANNSYLLPEGSEQILYTNKGLYLLFESASWPYRETANIPNDQIYLIRY